MNKRFSILASGAGKITATLGLAIGLLGVGAASAAPRSCTFVTNDAHYGHQGQFGPAEPMKFSWNVSTGQVTGFSWQHGGAEWYAFPTSRGTVTQEVYYQRFELGFTTRGYETVRYSLKGYLAPNIALPRVSFAALYEGTGTTWLVALGELYCQ